MESEIRNKKRKCVALAMSLTGELFGTVNLIPPFLVDEDEERDLKKKNKPTRILNYLERTIPNMTERMFRSHFRISRNTFESLLPLINDRLKKTVKVGRTRMQTEKMLLATLWILATPDSYRSVGDRFDMGKSSLNYSFFKIIKILCSFATKIISWPSTLEEHEASKKEFKKIAGLPGCIGAIDGTFIPIKAPEVYITRKCNYAITLQATCDAKLKYTDCFVGYPGSVSDTRIFRNSDIYKSALINRAELFFQGEYIVGDKAYPVLDWCIPPYIDRGNLSAMKINFNIVVSQTRQVIERSFALLFGRFRRLKFLDMNKVEQIPTAIMACCVLHNLCLNSKDDIDLNELIEEGRNFVEGHNDNPPQNIENETREGNNFRNYLCDLLNQ